MELIIKNLKMNYFSGDIFDDINIEINKGERVGILGENGTGKSTVFKIIYGEEKQVSGDVFIRKGLKIGYLRQIPEKYDDLTVKEVLLEGFGDIYTIENIMRSLEVRMAESQENINELMEIYSKYQIKYESLGAYDVIEKLSKICIGLQISDEKLFMNYSLLSGGEKTTVGLGKLLLEEPDILLLDEPTNHLDIERIEWLEEYLKSYKGGVLIISHDRYFLDRVIDRIYEIKGGTTHRYPGNYSYYLKERVERYNSNLRHYNAQNRKIKQLEEAAKRMREWGKRADNESMFVKAKSIERRIDKMDKIDRPNLDSKGLGLSFDLTDRSGKEVIRVSDFDLRIGNRLLCENIDFIVFFGDKVGIIGPNGCGKSTLIKKIMNTSSENEKIKLGSGVKIGYLEQDIVFENGKLEVLETFKNEFPMPDGEIRNYLARFKFYGNEVFKSVDSLSGGEKVRLKLAVLMKMDINCLILDEPTNHIDIKTKEVLEDAIENFEGTVIFISHDRYFLNKVSNRIFLFEENKIKVYDLSYEDYVNMKKKEKSTFVREGSIKVNKNKINKAARKNNVKETYKVKYLEREINIIEHQVKDLRSRLYSENNDYLLIQKLENELQILENELESKMEEYFLALEK